MRFGRIGSYFGTELMHGHRKLIALCDARERPQRLNGDRNAGAAEGACHLTRNCIIFLTYISSNKCAESSREACYDGRCSFFPIRYRGFRLARVRARKSKGRLKLAAIVAMFLSNGR